MPRLILSQRAWRSIVDDCLAHPDVETGGALIGRKVGKNFVVPFVVPSGSGAIRERSAFSPDPTFQQVLLDYLFARFETDYVGDWHRHPGSFDRPSHKDWKTARHIVESPEWNVPDAVFPIAVVEFGRVRLRAYHMNRQISEFRELSVSVVSDNNRRIRYALVR